MKKFEKIQQEMDKISKQNERILRTNSLKSTKKKSGSLNRMTEESIKDSYVGDMNSSLLNKQILENGDNKNNFLRRGTLVVNNSIQNINESLGQIFQVGKNVVIPEESMENQETFEGLTADEMRSRAKNRIFETVNATKDNSQREISNNPHLMNSDNPFNTIFSETKEHRTGQFNRIIVSDSEKLNSIEEDKLEKSLIEENITKNNRSMNKRGKNFDETMNNIYDDLDKTFDHLDIEKSDSDDDEILNKDNYLGDILTQNDQHSNVLNRINDRYLKKPSLNMIPKPKPKFPQKNSSCIVFKSKPKINKKFNLNFQNEKDIHESKYK
jgi:hypothetical protein